MRDIMDNEDIYSQKDLDEERETVIDRVLEIIDGCKFKYKEDEVTAWDGILWHNRALEQAKQAVLALKGEQNA